MDKDIRVVVYKTDGGNWIAQGLEFDICAQGKDPAQALERFEVQCDAEADARLEMFGDSVQGLEAAPERFFGMWDNAESLKREKCSDGREVDIRLVA